MILAQKSARNGKMIHCANKTIKLVSFGEIKNDATYAKIEITAKIRRLNENPDFCLK